VNAHHPAEGIDVAQSARHLVSVIEGLRWPLPFGAYAEHEALDVLDAQLDQSFGTARPHGPPSPRNAKVEPGLRGRAERHKADPL
jgi:hypothetical protein